MLSITVTIIEIILLIMVIVMIIVYRRFPVHLIYRSKIGFESMLDAVNEPLAVISQDFTIKRMNKAYTEMVGRSYKNSINSKCYQTLRGRSSPCEDCQMKKALSETAIQEVELSPHPRDKDGSINITFAPYAMPIGGNTAEICIIEHIRDITTLETLKMSLERRNTFLASLTEQLRSAQRSIKAELHVARQIQLGLLPSAVPTAFNRIRIDMTYQPVADVGGDLYDFIKMPDNRLGIFIGDASGHGLASSLIGTLSKMSLYNHSQAGLSTAQLLERMDKDLNAHIHTSHYLTCFWCVLDFEKNLMSYSRAGHPMQVVQRKNGEHHWLSGYGIFLGITGEATYEQKEFAFETGDRFFWFTDGIYDVYKKNGDDGEKGVLLGYDKFTEMVKKTAGLPFEEIIGALRKGLSEFEHEDDYTLIVAEICDEKQS